MPCRSAHRPPLILRFGNLLPALACLLSATALVAYKCTDLYRPTCQAGLAWNDPQLNIRWPVANPILSAQDEKQPRLADISVENLPEYEPAEIQVMPRRAA